MARTPEQLRLAQYQHANNYCSQSMNEPLRMPGFVIAFLSTLYRFAVSRCASLQTTRFICDNRSLVTRDKLTALDNSTQYLPCHLYDWRRSYEACQAPHPESGLLS